MDISTFRYLAIEAFDLNNHRERFNNFKACVESVSDGDYIEAEAAKHLLRMYLKEYMTEGSDVDEYRLDNLVNFYSNNSKDVIARREQQLLDERLEADRQLNKSNDLLKFDSGLKMVRLFLVIFAIASLVFFWNYVGKFETFQLFGKYEVSQLTLRILYCLAEVLIIIYGVVSLISPVKEEDLEELKKAKELKNEQHLVDKLESKYNGRILLDTIIKYLLLLFGLVGIVTKLFYLGERELMKFNTFSGLVSLPILGIFCLIIYIVFRFFNYITTKPLLYKLHKLEDKTRECSL